MPDPGFKNILVPLDLSQSSLNALETAINIGVRNRSTIALLFVKETQSKYNNFFGDHNPLNIEDNAEDILQALCLNIRKKHSLDVVVFNAEGFVSAAIIDMSVRWNADLIVLGAHGASGFRQLFIGSTTYTVIKTATCPVLAVPSLNQSTDFRKILLPLRIDSAIKRDYLCLKDIFSNTNVHLEIMGLSKPNSSEYKYVFQNIITDFQASSPSNRLKVSNFFDRDIDVAESILYQIQLRKSDLLIITPSIDNSDEHYHVGPNAQKIISRCQVPFLSIRKSYDHNSYSRRDHAIARL